MRASTAAFYSASGVHFYVKWTSDVPTLVHITEASQGLMKWIPSSGAK